MTLLEEHRQSQVFLAPPQIYELSRLLHFPAIDQLQSFIQTRQSGGLERWMPVMTKCSDGTMFILPGDERYPVDPEMIAKQPVNNLDCSIVDQEPVKGKNLVELRDKHFQAVCTVETSFAHVHPISYPDKFVS